jgi:TldD protein
MSEVVKKIIDYCINNKVKYSDVRLQRKEITSVSLKDGKLDKVYVGEDYGVGIRVLTGHSWGFSSSNRVDQGNYVKIADKAIKISSYGKRGNTILSESNTVVDDIPLKVKIDPRKISLEDKISYLEELVYSTKIEDSRVVNTSLSYNEEISHLEFRNTEGSMISMALPRIKLVYSVTSKENHRLAWNKDGVSGSTGFEMVKDNIVDEKMRKVSYDSLELLKGEKTPSGKMPVIMSPDVVGLFIHEAFGHSSEADSILQGRSYLKDKLNMKIASEVVNVISNPLLKEGVGYYAYDDEGTPARKVILVKNGMLKSYMHTRETSQRFDARSSGNARAEDYSFEPIVRMNNLYIEPGEWKEEEIIEETKKGIYIKTSLGGMEDPERGAFQFNVNACYYIKNGEIASPLRNTCLAGSSIPAMNSIDAIGKNLGVSAGTCGKGEPSMQMVPVSNGGPSIRVNNIIVGGST